MLLLLQFKQWVLHRKDNMAENKKRFPGFVGPAYQSRSERFDCQRLVNMYIEMDELGAGKGSEPAVLIGTPGLEFLQTIGAGPIRCVYTQGNLQITYVVSGNQVYAITGANATPTLVSGSLLTSSGPVQMADNGTQAIIVDGQYGFWFDVTISSPVLTQLTDVHFHPTDTITFQDGYFIGVDKGADGNGTGNFFISDLYSISFLPLNEANIVASNTGILKAVISCGDLLYMLGSSCVEIWADVGTSGSTPFQRQPARISQIGCAAANSVVILGETIFWLGSNTQGGGIVYTLNNGMPMRISNHAIEYAIQKFNDLESATAYSYQQEGHFFYLLNIPGTNTTWVYDNDANQWHERQSTVNGITGRHLGNCHALLNNDHIIGDYSNGNIYRYNLDVYTDNGQVVNRIRQTPHVSDSLNNIFYKLLEVDMQFGVGLDDISGNGTTPGSNPQIVLQISNDGGQTWGNPIYATMGKIGQYRTRARWQRLGYSRDRVFRLIISEPVRVSLLSAMLDVEQGNS